MKNLFSTFGLLALFIATNLSAASIVSTIGDKDGFGIGATDGSFFDWNAVGSGDGDGTDDWTSGSDSWVFTYDLTGFGSLTSASLDIFHGGDGLNALASVTIDGVNIGTLTDAETDSQDPNRRNFAVLDTFNLSSYLYLLDGSDTVTINVAGGDGWVLDYMELTVSNAGVSSVPVPAALFMFAPALLGFFGLRRKVNKAA